MSTTPLRVVAPAAALRISQPKRPPPGKEDQEPAEPAHGLGSNGSSGILSLHRCHLRFTGGGRKKVAVQSSRYILLSRTARHATFADSSGAFFNRCGWLPVLMRKFATKLIRCWPCPTHHSRPWSLGTENLLCGSSQLV